MDLGVWERVPLLFLDEFRDIIIIIWGILSILLLAALVITIVFVGLSIKRLINDVKALLDGGVRPVLDSARETVEQRRRYDPLRRGQSRQPHHSEHVDCRGHPSRVRRLERAQPSTWRRGRGQLMIRWARRRLRLSRSRALDPRRLGVDRALNALPGNAVADALGDLVTRRATDFGDIAGQVVERLGQLATQVGGEAANLSESDAASQLRELASRAAGRTAQLAYRSGVDRLFAPPPPPRRRGSDLGLLLLAAGAGFAVGGGLILILTQRRKAVRPVRGSGVPENDEITAASEATGEAVPAPAARLAAGATALDRAFDTLRRRLESAKSEARRTRAQAESRLWQQYHGGVSEPRDTPAC